MALGFQNITHCYGKNTVLSELNLEADTGDITCLFGASGSGKSTLLRIAAGLEPVQHGQVLLNSRILADAQSSPPPEKRPIGLMFQESALFPHMSIADNITFGLSGTKSSEKQAVVDHWLAAIGLEGFGDRPPHTLSGGQAQRVALARSLAPRPEVLLMDEPYASIDTILRKHLRETTRQTLKEHGTTAIFVTHDPVEAMAMADRIAILEDGCIVQYGEPQALFETPRTAAIANLFGGAQPIAARAVQGGFDTEYGYIKASQSTLVDGGECTLAFRPEGVIVDANEQGGLQVVDLRYVGRFWLLYLLPVNAAPGAVPLVAACYEPSHFTPGTRCDIAFAEQNWFCFNEA